MVFLLSFRVSVTFLKDERTRIYKKLVGFEGNTLELSSRVMECMQYSRVS